MSALTPDIVLKKTWQRIPSHLKVTFFSAFLIGIFANLYLITNFLPNHDEVLFIIASGQNEWGPGHGRWLLEFTVALTGIFSLPWVNGLLSILYLSISACMVIQITRVKNTIYCILISGIMMLFPTVAAILTFMQLSAPFFLSLMLACFSAFLADRYKYGYIFATIPIVLSMAIYQAFYSVTAALLILVLVLEVLDNQTSWQKTVIKGLKFAGALIFGMIMYLISVRIIYPDGLSMDYQGLDQMGQISLSDLPFLIRTSYVEIIKFFVIDNRNLHYSFMNILFILSFVACGILIVFLCIKKKIYHEPIKLLLLSALLIMLPFGCNLIYLMGATLVHELMIYATVFIFVLLLIIAGLFLGVEKKDFNESNNNKIFEIIPKISAWFITIVMIVTMYNYWIFSNQMYFKLNIEYQTTYAQSILLVSHIQSTPGYTYDKDIVILGSPPYFTQGIPELQQIQIKGVTYEKLLGCCVYPYFLRNFLNFTQNVEHLWHNDLFLGVINRDEDVIKAMTIMCNMPVFPNSGSIVIVDDVIYVKFSHINVEHFEIYCCISYGE